jgi:TatD DNase family protein
MIDTHCHLDSPAFDADRDAVLARAREAGVSWLMIPAVGPDRWDALREGYSRRSGVRYGLGIHPQLLPEIAPQDDYRHLARLEELLASGGASAVGECGLDGPTAAQVPMDRQVSVLREHFALARRFKLPLLLHCLRAHEPMLQLLEQEAPVAGVLHSYSGSAEQVKLYLRFDLYFSFAGPLTYPNARKPVKAARAVPRERLLVETDAPDQTPRPFSGRCEPAYVVKVAEGLAGALQLPLAEVEALTDANARRLFG